MQRTNRISAAWLLLGLILLGSSASAGSVNKSIRIEAGTQSSGDSTVNGSVSVGAGAVVSGPVESVNGSINIDDNVQVESVGTVNGGIRIGDGIVTDGIESVNGAIRIGPSAQIQGSVEVVNGKILLDRDGRVGGDLETVNGEISIVRTEVGGDIRTVNGNVSLNEASTVRGDIIIEKPGGWGWGRQKRKPKVTIGPGSRVEGRIVAEREIELYISESASVGGVSGEASLEDAIRFTGDRP